MPYFTTGIFFVGTLGKAKMSDLFIDCDLPLDCAYSYSQSLRSAGTKVVLKQNQNKDEAYIGTTTYFQIFNADLN